MRSIVIQITAPCFWLLPAPASLLSSPTSNSLAPQGLCRCCHCVSPGTPSPQLCARPSPCVLFSLFNAKSPRRPWQPRPRVLPAFALPEITLFFTISLLDCALSLSVVDSQLGPRFNPQLECHSRGMGLIFLHLSISASGNHIWGWSAVACRASKRARVVPHAACAYSK